MSKCCAFSDKRSVALVIPADYPRVYVRLSLNSKHTPRHSLQGRSFVRATQVGVTFECAEAIIVLLVTSGAMGGWAKPREDFPAYSGVSYS